MSFFATSAWLMLGFVVIIAIAVCVFVLCFRRIYSKYTAESTIHSQTAVQAAAQRELQRLQADHDRINLWLKRNGERLAELGHEVYGKDDSYPYEREGLVYIIKMQKEQILLIEHWRQDKIAEIATLTSQNHVTT